MKAIELTEEHKTKLLEMCNKLFPECLFEKGFKYKSKWSTGRIVDCVSKGICIEFGSDPEYGYREIEESLQITMLDGEYLKTESIHWFEFCMKHLVYKIFNESNSVQTQLELNKTILYLMNSNVNVIDHLYEQFKKLYPDL